MLAELIQAERQAAQKVEMAVARLPEPVQQLRVPPLYIMYCMCQYGMAFVF